jgi:hypothetical protein
MGDESLLTNPGSNNGNVITGVAEYLIRVKPETNPIHCGDNLGIEPSGKEA